MADTPRFDRRLCVCVDAQRYGSNDDQAQADIQHDLVRLLDAAAEGAGLDRTGWRTQGTGDGKLALMPLGRTEPRVVDDFIRQLDATLTRTNRRMVAEARLRLRVAIHQGVAYPADNGFAGQGVVVVSRLVDAAPVRGALAAAVGANLAVILSDVVYTDLIVHGHTTLRPNEFRAVPVSVKEFAGRAWVRVPGADVHALDLTPPAPVPPATQAANANGNSVVNQAGRDLIVGNRASADGQPAPTAGPMVVTVHHGDVHGENITFGVSGGTGG